MKLGKIESAEGGFLGWGFSCPGCDSAHYVPSDGRWTFNGDLERPSFSPSILLTWQHGETMEWRRCHLFVREGRAEFCGDCTHALAGKTAELPDYVHAD